MLVAFCCRNRSRADASSARRMDDNWSSVAPFFLAFSSMMRCSSRKYRFDQCSCVQILGKVIPFVSFPILSANAGLLNTKMLSSAIHIRPRTISNGTLPWTRKFVVLDFAAFSAYHVISIFPVGSNSSPHQKLCTFPQSRVILADSRVQHAFLFAGCIQLTADDGMLGVIFESTHYCRRKRKWVSRIRPPLCSIGLVGLGH